MNTSMKALHDLNTGRTSLETKYRLPIWTSFLESIFTFQFFFKSSCPFCEELSELYSFQDISKPLFPSATKSYIEKRIKEIGRIDLNHEPNSPTPEYIPYEKLYFDEEVKKERKQYDIVSIFLMCYKLGKIDSYRF